MSDHKPGDTVRIVNPPKNAMHLLGCGAVVEQVSDGRGLAYLVRVFGQTASVPVLPEALEPLGTTEAEALRAVRTPTIDALKELQRELGLGGVHVIFFGESWFNLAHTDEERVTLGDLSRCEVHRWAAGLDRAPCRGYAIIERGADGQIVISCQSLDPWRVAPVPEDGAEPEATTVVTVRYFHPEADTPDGMVEYSQTVPVHRVHQIIETMDEVAA